MGILMQDKDFLCIFKMQRVNQSESFHQIEMRETHAVSPDSIMREDVSSEAIPAQGVWRCYWKQCTFLAMILLCSMMFGYEINTQKVDRVIDGKNVTDNFDFMVFCPATEDDLRKYHHDQDLRRRLLVASSYRIEIDQADESNYLLNRTYLVTVNSSIDQNGNLVLQYCGRMKLFQEECTGKPDQINCTASPMFDIYARESVDIIWVNNLDKNHTINETGECIDVNKAKDGHCTLQAKFNSTRTFVDPTTHVSSSNNDTALRISYQRWPISTHVHGAEVRPVFDGNPLSWIINDKTLNKFGVGTFSLYETCYFKSFQQSPDPLSTSNPPRIKLFDQKNNSASNFKVNRYPNKQNPGTLWYHDHAMRLTNFNVQHGLAGFYILRDPDVQKYLGIDRSNEKFVLINNNSQKYELSGLVANKVYRFRFLNANYGFRATLRYSFSYNGCNITQPDLQSFTLIGADSSLFDHGIEGQKHFVISNAERIDLLIKFKKNSNDTLLSICGDSNTTVFDQSHNKDHIDSNLVTKGPNSIYNIKDIDLKTYSKSDDKNTRTDISNIDLSPWVAYTDLSLQNESNIAVKRYRPLININGTNTIHGRKDFHSGHSEDPMIGSTEDWFLINTYGVGHPIHVHLINFQVIKEYNLSLFNNTNTYYQLDFVAQALKNATGDDQFLQLYKNNVFLNQHQINYTYLKTNLTNITNHPQVIISLSSIYPEDQHYNKSSGLDLFAKHENGSYKYIQGEGHPSPKVFYSKWKDTAYVDGHKALQYRIRWAKSNYNQAVDAAKGTYFHVPADQLREFPGFVYHCHILPHEDNEMMRPIMLQMPQTALSASAPCNYQSWAEKVKCINQNCGNL